VGTWLVTGTGRGIGFELARQLHARGDTVIAACRTSTPELDAIRCEVITGIDVTSDDVGKALDAALGDRSLDVIVNNAGLLRPGPLDKLDLDGAVAQFQVNTLGPLRVTSALLPRLGSGAKVAIVSSRAGSIGDKPSGGMYGYRISKAGANMVGANLAHDLAPRGIHVVVLHPGFIRTEMTGGLGNEETDQSAAGLLARIDELDASRSGRFFHAHGEELPW
jgi:NAD(P)-dependent dehydrogenase (short-subunit alcohol dehydrogenase family)